MHLKSLDINGFKSFAEPTHLEFQPPRDGANSITAIIGPNGSGKSNIADAVQWVMGEQSLKQLRGKKSHDIIFAGSAGKGSMGAATVTMTLDNSDHRAPIDYEELVITRRLYRSGESEYIVNGNTVRLIDLQILLAQAQFGQGSYAVIGQGMIDHLLLQSAEERKDFFDEAVGIKEFQLKRHHALLKLHHTKENIVQAELVLQEVEPRLRILKRQVHKLEQRQEVELKLREWQERYYYTLHHEFAQKLESITRELKKVDDIYRADQSRMTAAQDELSALAHEAGGEQFRELQDTYQRLMKERTEAEKDLAVLSGKLQTEFSRAGKHNVGWIENKVGELQRQKHALAEELGAESELLKKYRSEFSELISELARAEREKIRLQRAQTEGEKQLYDLKQGHHEMALEGLKAVQAIITERGRFPGTVYGMVAQLADVEEKFRVALEVAAQSHMASIVVETDHVAEACIAFLKEQQLGVATFLPLNTIRPRAIPQDINELLKVKGVYGLATELVQFKSIFADIFSYVFGSTLIVHDIDVARRIGIGRVRMVTLEGDLLEVSGSMKGGFRRRRERGIHFSQKGGEGGYREVEALEKELTETVEELQKVEKEFSLFQEQRVGAETNERVQAQKITLLEERQRELLREISALEQERALSSMDSIEYSQLMKEFTRDREKLAAHIETLAKKIAEAEKKVVAFHEDEERKRERIFKVQDTLRHAQDALQQVAARRNELQMEMVKLETHEEDVEQELFDQLKIGAGALKDKGVEPFGPDALDDAKVEIEKLKYTLSLIGGIDEGVMVEYTETKGKYEHLTSELDDLSKAYADLEELIAELDALMKKRHAETFTKMQKEFARYFKLLFDGGKAELVEVYGEEEEMQNAEFKMQNEGEEEEGKRKRGKILRGIEVQACPPGKKITNIQALSGGEKTLTSIALVCAILHVNPPPFVMLDEVEAALDEANTLRFTRILHELSRQSQFVIITHNRVTMHAADVLYGVTMGEDGISKLVSVKMK